MKTTLVRLAMGIGLLVLGAAPALAAPPNCEDVCFYRPASYHCHYYPSTITCGEFCTVYCPGSCDLGLEHQTSADALPWEADNMLVSADIVKQPEDMPPVASPENAG